MERPTLEVDRGLVRERGVLKRPVIDGPEA